MLLPGDFYANLKQSSTHLNDISFTFTKTQEVARVENRQQRKVYRTRTNAHYISANEWKLGHLYFDRINLNMLMWPFSSSTVGGIRTIHTHIQFNMDPNQR